MKPDTELLNRKSSEPRYMIISVDYLQSWGEKKRLKNCIKKRHSQKKTASASLSPRTTPSEQSTHFPSSGAIPAVSRKFSLQGMNSEIQLLSTFRMTFMSPSVSIEDMTKRHARIFLESSLAKNRECDIY